MSGSVVLLAREFARDPARPVVLANRSGDDTAWASTSGPLLHALGLDGELRDTDRFTPPGELRGGA